MDSSEYYIAWTAYLIAAGVGSWIAWRILRRVFSRGISVFIQCLLLAVLFTPWYVLPDQEYMAPAYIIFVMDSITMDSTAGIRALIPLVMAMMGASLLALLLIIMGRFRRS